MAKAEESWSPWGKKRKVDVELLKSFGRQCRLHTEAELQHLIAREREKVLCDLAVHAEYINQWLEAAETQLREGPQYDPQAPQSDCFLLPQDQQVPDSYMARLLHGTTLQQVQQVLSMTPQEWANSMTDWFAEFSVQIEFLTRPDQDMPAADAAQENLQQQLSRASGSFGFTGTVCRVSSAPAAYGAPTTAALGASPASQGALQQWQDAASFSSQGTAGCLSAASAPLGTSPGAASADMFGASTAAAHGAPAAAAPGGLLPPAHPLQRSGNSGSWSLQRCPINLHPARAREALEAVVDRGMHMCGISTVLGRMVHIAGEAILTGGAVDTHMDNSEAITDRLQLTELQELHLYLAIAELARMNSSVQEQGAHLLQLAAETTLQLAAATAQSSSSITQSGPSTQSGPKQQQRRQQRQRQSQVTQDPLELTEGLEGQLQRVSASLHRNMVSVFLFVVNTFTKHQLAVLSVACYPRIASVFTVAHVVHRRVQKQQQALLAEVERSSRQTGTLPAPLVDHPQAGLFALFGRGCSITASSDKSSKSQQSAAHSSMLVARYKLQEHEQQRTAQLLHHQKVCWEQLGCQPLQQ